MGHYLSIGIGLSIGALVVVQGAMNGTLVGFVGGSLPAALCNFLVGVLVLVAASLVTGTIGGMQGIVTAPKWSLLGGVAGALLVMGTAYLIPRIGTAHTVALIMCGQVCVSMVIDHFGLLGVPIIAISPQRIVGCVLLALGAYVVGR
jgi:transporter family-2 protein